MLIQLSFIQLVILTVNLMTLFSWNAIKPQDIALSMTCTAICPQLLRTRAAQPIKMQNYNLSAFFSKPLSKVYYYGVVLSRYKGWKSQLIDTDQDHSMNSGDALLPFR